MLFGRFAIASWRGVQNRVDRFFALFLTSCHSPSGGTYPLFYRIHIALSRIA